MATKSRNDAERLVNACGIVAAMAGCYWLGSFVFTYITDYFQPTIRLLQYIF